MRMRLFVAVAARTAEEEEDRLSVFGHCRLSVLVTGTALKPSRATPSINHQHGYRQPDFVGMSVDFYPHEFFGSTHSIHRAIPIGISFNVSDDAFVEAASHELRLGNVVMNIPPSNVHCAHAVRHEFASEYRELVVLDTREKHTGRKEFSINYLLSIISWICDPQMFRQLSNRIASDFGKAIGLTVQVTRRHACRSREIAQAKMGIWLCESSGHSERAIGHYNNFTLFGYNDVCPMRIIAGDTTITRQNDSFMPVVDYQHNRSGVGEARQKQYYKTPQYLRHMRRNDES
jgi:hypothetical protein